MRRSRRRLVVGSALAWVAAGVRPAGASVISDAPAQPGFGGPEAVPLFGNPAGQEAVVPELIVAAPTRRALRAYVDTLIPADESPSGSALGVDARLQALAKGDATYGQLLARGFAWLDEQARVRRASDFAALGEAARDEVLSVAAAQAPRTLPRTFLDRTRLDAFSHYYAQPQSWRGFAHYRGPPQPAGFPDHAAPPRRSR